MLNLIKSATLAAGLMLAACGAQEVSEPVSESASVDVDAGEYTSDHLDVEVIGSGPDVLLIPGLASSAAVWDSVTGRLSDDYTFHVVQVAGFGGAPSRGNSDQDQILNTLAADLADYTNSLNEPPVIIGHSLGGLLALKVGLNEAAEVKQLMTIDVLPFFSVLIDPNATPETIEPIASFAKLTLLAQSDEVFAARQKEALAGLVKDEAGLELALSWSVASDREVMAQAMYEVMVLDMRDQMAGLGKPLTVLFARDETLPNMDNVEALYRDLYEPAVNSEVIPIDGAYHFIMFDQEEVFLNEIKSFLDAN